MNQKGMPVTLDGAEVKELRALSMNELYTHWQRHVRLEHADWAYRVLETLYGSDPMRAYHTLAHIDECLHKLDALAADQPEGKLDRDLASLALIFHDAVYVPGHPDNETNSAALLDGLRFTLNDETRAGAAAPLIFATRHKAEEGAFGDVTCAAVVDIDLSVLGRDSAGYADYVRLVRREFAHVSDVAWRVGRSGFLTQMLSRKRIYTLAAMRADFEANARANMSAELSHLTK